jgi:pimeloyl-ACP methyl ester carboxylesterase
MHLDISIHKGKKDKPAVIFIHGLGMDKNFWIDPLNTKIFAKNIPLKVFAASKPKPCTLLSAKKITVGEFQRKIETLWIALKKEGFNLICWSQRKTYGPIKSAVEELAWIMEKTKRLFPKAPIALIGHSRGGLIARKFLENKNCEVKALITISTPHSGSSIARLVKYVKPFSVLLMSTLPKNTHGKISKIVKNIKELLEDDAVRDLLPGSSFFENLRDSPQKSVKYISFGGKEPGLLTVYVRKKIGGLVRHGGKMYPKPLLTIPDSLLKIFPSFMVADEITPGNGDGLVTAKSSFLPWASRHYNVQANHISIIWNRKTIKKTIEALKTI